MASVRPTISIANQTELSFRKLPVELVDDIVSLLPRQDVFNVRLAHPELAAKSYRAFVHSLFGSSPSFYANRESYRRLSAICRHVEVSRFIKSISLDTGCPGRNLHRLFDPSRIGRALSKLPNLKSLDLVDCVSEASHCPPCSRALFFNIHIPKLEKLSMSLTNIDAESLARFISRHFISLEAIELKCVTLVSGSWPVVLEAIGGLQTNAKVEIFAPCECDFEVSFLPEEDDPNTTFVRLVETRRRDGGRKYSYNLQSVHEEPRTKDGISKGVQCMLRSYRLEICGVEGE